MQPKPSLGSFPPQELLTRALAAALGPIVREAVAEALAEHAGGAPPTPLLLTIDQLGAALGLSRSGINKLRREGLPVVMVLGSLPRFDRDAVRAFLERRSREQHPVLTPAGNVSRETEREEGGDND